MAKKKPAPPKPPRKRQEHLPQMEPEKIPDIHEAAQKYEDARVAHVKATKLKNGCKQKLIEAMDSHEKKKYAYGDIYAERDVKDDVKVRIKSAEDPQAKSKKK